MKSTFNCYRDHDRPLTMVDPLRPIGRPILGGRVNFPVCLAPMVGLSHVAFRELLRAYLPKGAVTIWPTEMLNSRRIPLENLQTTPETMRGANESDLVPQILGNESEPIRLSVQRLEHEWGASGIDINMGCPVKKALSHNYGVALMGDAGYAAKVVEMAVSSTTLPVSVKLRAGHNNDRDYLLNFVRGLESAGAAWISLHPRTAEMKRRGQADWSQIKEIRDQIKIAVIGNGDIQIVEDAFAMREQTGCDLAMAGRVLTARPWLFWQVGEQLGYAPPEGRSGHAPSSPLEEGAEYGQALKQLSQLMQKYFAPELALRKFRFFVRTGSPWLFFGHDLYARTTRAKDFLQLEESMDEFFSKPQEMVARTELRQ